MRKYLAGALLALSLLLPGAAAAQVCPAVAALPDSERRVAYTLSGTTGPMSVTFPLLGEGTDYGSWIEVWVDGVLKTPVTDWTLTIPSGTLATACRPITNASVNFVAPQTGTVQIVGSRRPRRTTQFPENQGVAARSLNQAFTDVIAQNREVWDKINDVTGRGIFSQPGVTLGRLPTPANCASKVLGFDATGLNPTCSTVTGGGGGAGLVIGSSPITGGVNGRLLLDASGTLSELAPAALTKVDDTNVTLTLGGTPLTALLQATSLALGWTGNLSVPRGGTGAGTFTPNLPLLGNGTGVFAQGTRSGNTTSFATTNGTMTNGDCVAIDPTGNLVAAGGPCTTGGGSGTVTAGTLGQLAWYAANGSTVSGNANHTVNAGKMQHGVPGSVVGSNLFANLTSGTIEVLPPTGALGTVQNTLQAAADVFVYRNTPDTLTNKNINGATNTLTGLPATQLAGNIPVANLNGGAGASATTFWAGDASWKTAVTSLVCGTGLTGGTVTTTGTCALDIATSTNIWSATANKPVDSAGLNAAAAPVTLTDAATIATDMNTGINFSVTLAGNRTLGNPTNPVVGRSGCYFLIQDGTGTRTLAYASNWKFGGGTAPVLTTTAGAVDMLCYIVRTSTFIVATITKDVR